VDFNALLRIGTDERVLCLTGKIEMGQGIITPLPQMLADELDVSYDAVDILYGRLTMGKIIEKHLRDVPPLKKPAECRVMGKPCCPESERFLSTIRIYPQRAAANPQSSASAALLQRRFMMPPVPYCTNNP
jgi:hypothetical protein